MARVKQSGRLLLAVGVHSGAAYKVALPHIAQEDLGKIPLVAISRDGLDVDYTVRGRLERELPSGVISGPLGAVMSKATQDESRLVLTRFLLKCVGEAWGTTAEALREQTWHLEFKDDVLWAELQKP